MIVAVTADPDSGFDRILNTPTLSLLPSDITPNVYSIESQITGMYKLMKLEVVVDIIGIIIDILLANKAMSHLDGLLKFTAGFIFVFGFIGLVYAIFSEETAGTITGLYLFALIVGYITKEK